MIIKSFKIFENLQQAKSILKSKNIPEDDYDFIYLRNMLSRHMGYIGWFTNNYYNNHIPLVELEHLYDIITNNPEVIDGLKSPVISYTDWERLTDDIIKSRNNISIKRILNEFPKEQKSLININNDKEVSLLIKLSTFKDNKNFLNKISRYKTKKDLLDAINLFTTDERKEGYTNIKNAINKSGANIVYDSHFDNIIVCEVNYEQLKYLASDTSWCILREYTFDSYADGIDKQYIIFLTDKTNNYSKIGITYGIRYRTSHLVNDEYIDLKKVSNILSERGTSIDILKRDVSEILNSKSFTNVSVSKLISHGFEESDILKNKKIYTTLDLKNFTEEQIKKYDLHNKIEISYNTLESYNVDYIKRVESRINFKFSIRDILRIKPIKRCTELLDYDILDADSKKFLKFLKETKMENLKKALSKVKDNQVFNGIYTFIFTLEYYNTKDTLTLSHINSLIEKDVVSGTDEFAQFIFNNLTINPGDAKTLFEIFDKLKTNVWHGDNRNSKEIIKWLTVLETFPILLEDVKKVIEGFNQSAFNSLDDKYIKILNKKYPGLFNDRMLIRKEYLLFKIIKEIFPNTTFENYGIGRREYKEFMKKNGYSNEIITPLQYYDNFYDGLKDAHWPSGYNWGTTCAPTFGMIFSLCKLDMYDEIGKLDINWSIDFTGKLIRLALDVGLFTSNSRKYLPDSWMLSDDEKEKLFTYLMANIKDRIGQNTSNLISEIEMDRHKVFSLIYYIYGWGFNIYFNKVEKCKNVYKDNWKVINGVNTVERQNIRLEYFEHIFMYLIKKDLIQEIKDLIDRIMSWKMTKTEIKMTGTRLSVWFSHSDKKSELDNYIFPKYFDRELKYTPSQGGW